MPLVLEDSQGRELFKIQQKVLRLRNTMEIEDADGHKVATVKEALITPLRERFEVEVERDGTKVAEVSKKWFMTHPTR